MDRKVTPEVAQALDARIRELEACLGKAHWVIANGYSSETVRETALREIKRVLGWPVLDRDAILIPDGSTPCDCGRGERHHWMKCGY